MVFYVVLTAIKYVDILSQVLEVNVEIVDSQLIRVAGTGKYKNKLNESLEKEGHVYRRVLKLGESLIISDPGKNEICIECPNSITCIEKFEMCVPINLNNEVIGVTGFICFNEEQRKKIIVKINTCSVFLEQIAEMISAKVFENIENEKITTMTKLLSLITDEIDEANVILDKNYYISHLNKKAGTILKVHNEDNLNMNIEHTGNELVD